MNIDEKYMHLAILQALKAKAKDEVPVGAIIVKDDKVIARAYNTRNSSKDATAHAELIAIKKACKVLGDWRLQGCSMYVTLQPCMMCMGACYNARIDNLYYGASDTNCSNSINSIDSTTNILNHTIAITGGVLQQQCSNMITQYFASKRN